MVGDIHSTDPLNCLTYQPRLLNMSGSECQVSMTAASVPTLRPSQASMRGRTLAPSSEPHPPSRPRVLRPGATPPATGGFYYLHNEFAVTASKPLAVGFFQLDSGSNNELDLPLGMFQDPLQPFDPLLNADGLAAIGYPFSSLDAFSFGFGFAGLADPRAEPHHESISMAALDMDTLDLASTLHPLPGLLAEFSALPASIEPTAPVHFALQHYKWTLLLSNTTKNPTWSTSMVFLRLGSKRPLVMHFLLASSLKSIVSNQEVDNPSEMPAIAKHHFQMGAKLLVQELSNQGEPDHVNVMTAFWFLYLCRSWQANLEMGEVTKLT
jgi:hypothetical protein